MALIHFYQAPNEFMANSVKDLLEQNGVPAVIHSFQIPAYDGLAMVMRPNWGEVLVEEADRERAQELLDVFLASAEDSSTDD